METPPMRYVSSNIPPHHEVTRITPKDPSLVQSGDAGFSISFQYFNGLRDPVHVIQRSGMRIRIPQNVSGHQREFVVRVKLSVGTGVKINTEQLFDDPTTSTKSFLEAIDRVLKEGLVSESYAETTYTFDFYVSEDELRRGGGSLYLNNLDIVASTLAKEALPYHPFSEPGIRDQQLAENDEVNDVDTFGYTLQIVDNHNCYGPRFININGQVYKVPVCHRPRLPDGVYLVATGPSEVDHGFAKPLSERYTFEEADEKLHLFRSIEEARTLGDQIAQKEKELKTTGLWIKQEEQRLQQEAQRIKQERLDEEAKLKHERAEEEQHIREMKAREDERQREQKLAIEKAEADFKREEEEFKRSMARMKQEEEARQREALAEHERRLKRLKEEEAEVEHRRKMEDIRRKDEYEQRSTERKESSEMVKFLPAIVTAVAALFIAFSKLST